MVGGGVRLPAGALFQGKALGLTQKGNIMTASLTRNGWGSLHHDEENKTVLSGHGHRVRVELARDWTEINHFDSESEEYGHMVVLRTGSLAFTGFGNSQKEARQDAVRQARYNGYEPRSCK